MAKLLVHTAFNLTISPTLRKRFEVGVHLGVPLDEAEHWYTKEHATILSVDDDADVEIPAPAEPLTGAKRDVIVERLVALFRMNLAALADDKLVEMLAGAEHHSSSSIARARDAGVDVDGILDAPEPVATEDAAETDEPASDAEETADDGSEAESADTAADQDQSEASLSDADLLDAMTTEELRAYITKRDGKAPHHKSSHETLLKLAKTPASEGAASGEAF